MNTPATLLAAVRDAFLLPKRPEFFTAKSRDDEAARAEAMFASRTPETLQSTDVGIQAQWPEVFLNSQSRIYFMPGFVRLIIEASGDTGFQVSDFFAMLPPDTIDQFDQRQKSAMADVLAFIRERLDDRDKGVLDRRLQRLRN